jgi:hypothetical protein
MQKVFVFASFLNSLNQCVKMVFLSFLSYLFVEALGCIMVGVSD